ncbi:efflux RND transporter periplasmic adaptor subunit [Zoogloea sp.]|uniref:efflux RND transporter periplasmic adaptor subunit n=1 Tax=Zoogloea sp. TaxID=49181 RepID=UPI001416D686|nr:MAG: efflux RND transporter periplasmic adaptor subunit [Zoogloea sp.]
MIHTIINYFQKTFVIGITVGLISCSSDQDKSNESASEEHHEEEVHSSLVHLDQHKIFHAGIKTEVVQEKSIAVPLTLSGKVGFDERRIAHITSRIPGRVEEVRVFTNDNVASNMVVAEMYSQEYIALQYEFIQAIERKERSLQGSQDDQKTAQSLYESVLQKLTILELSDDEINALRTTKKPKQYYSIRAPFSGTILESKVKKGMFLQSGEELFDFADLSTVWVLADVYERDLARVRPGMKAVVTTTFYPGSFYGTITSIYNVVDEKTRTVKARIELNNSSRKLKPEMYCMVKIQTQFGKETIKIPSTALMGDTEKHYVFVAINDSTFERREIRTGVETKEFAEVLDGLLIGERIVVVGGFFLKSELAKETFGEEH